jgi:hypothetical protein
MVTKNIDEAKANFEASIGYIPDRYKSGVNKANWLEPAKSEAAEKNYADATSKAISQKSRQKAIAAMSNDDWKTAAINKGAPIIGERIRGSLDKYASEFGPILSAVNAKSAALPPATTDFRANITNRLVPIVETAKKAAGKL